MLGQIVALINSSRYGKVTHVRKAWRHLPPPQRRPFEPAQPTTDDPRMRLYHVHYIEPATGRLVECPDPRPHTDPFACPICGANVWMENIACFTQSDLSHYVEEGLIRPDLVPPAPAPSVDQLSRGRLGFADFVETLMSEPAQGQGANGDRLQRLFRCRPRSPLPHLRRSRSDRARGRRQAVPRLWAVHGGWCLPGMQRREQGPEHGPAGRVSVPTTGHGAGVEDPRVYSRRTDR